MLRCAADRRHHHQHPPRARPRAGQGRRPGPDAGRAGRPGDRAEPGPGRLDARRRLRGRHLRRQRDRRGRPPRSPPERPGGTDRPATTGSRSASSATARSTRASCWRPSTWPRCGGLPVVFVCENNRYATSMRVERLHRRQHHRTGRGVRHPGRDGGRHGLPSGAGRRGPGGATGPGPAVARRFLECLTYRFVGHHTLEYQARPRYRSDEEVDGRLRSGTRWTIAGRPGRRGRPGRDRRRDRGDPGPGGGSSALASPGAGPGRGAATTSTAAGPVADPGACLMPILSYLKALNRALGDEMERDPAVCVLRRGHRASRSPTSPPGCSRPVRPGPGDGHADVGAGLHQLRDRGGDGRPPPGGRVPDPVPAAAWCSSRSPTRPHKFSLMTGGQTSVPVTYLLPAPARGPAGPASIPTIRTACSRTSG